MMVAAPDPRRELEAVAAEIWSLLRRDPTLRFDDFAVVVPPASAETYLPLAREVFTSASELPHTVLDLPSPAEGHIIEAVELLLALPLGALGRRDLLPLAMHPTVARRFPEVDPQHCLALCEELGIVRGADGGALGDSYARRGSRQLGPGSAAAGAGRVPVGRAQRRASAPSILGGGAVLPAELPAGAEPAARALGILARELIAFARTAAALTGAARRVRGAAARDARRRRSTPTPTTSRRRCGRCFARAGADRRDGARRSRGRLPRSRRSWCAPGWAPRGAAARARRGRHGRDASRRCARCPSGWCSSSGSTSGCSRRRRDSARSICAAAAPQPGDVTPREQDQYLFLETLLSARERLTLSYVGARRGDRRARGSIVGRCSRCATCSRPAPAAKSWSPRSRAVRRWRATTTTTCAR